MLHKDQESPKNNIVSEEGQRQRFLCSNNESGERCPFSGFINPNQVSEDVALDYLASILVGAFLANKENE